VSLTAGSHPGHSSRDLSCPVAPSPTDFKPYCTSLLRVLFSVRSRYLFTIGLGEYLVLTDDACQIHEGFPTPATQELAHDVLDFDTGLSPCITLRSRRLLEDVRSMNTSPKHHISRRIRFGLRRFHSRLLTTSRSFSLPAGTEMFQFPAFPIARSNCGEEFPLGNLRFLASVRLP
jgi:hypothetical protein